MRIDFRLRIADCGLRMTSQCSCASRNPQSATRNSNGFTLLELVMVMTIIVVLAAIGVTSYQHIQMKARETVLKKDLIDMRKMIDEYAADRTWQIFTIGCVLVDHLPHI